MHPPKAYNWIGSAKTTLYWDDPDNWREGSFPNGREVIAVFSNSTKGPTEIVLRKDIHIAQIWISERNPITFSGEPREEAEPDDLPKIIFDTANQFSTLFLGEGNTADHTFKQRWILHSCYFNMPYRDLADPRVDDSKISTIHYDSEIANYKDPDRASLQVYGNIAVQLNRKNSFKGPVVVKRNGRLRVMKDGGIPDDSPIDLDEGGLIHLADGVVVKTSKLRIDGKEMPKGTYLSEDNSAQGGVRQQAISGGGRIEVV